MPHQNLGTRVSALTPMLRHPSPLPTRHPGSGGWEGSGGGPGPTAAPPKGRGPPHRDTPPPCGPRLSRSVFPQPPLCAVGMPPTRASSPTAPLHVAATSSRELRRKACEVGSQMPHVVTPRSAPEAPPLVSCPHCEKLPPPHCLSPPARTTVVVPAPTP